MKSSRIFKIKNVFSATFSPYVYPVSSDSPKSAKTMTSLHFNLINLMNMITSSSL